MATVISMSKFKKLYIFLLNISFLLLLCWFLLTYTYPISLNSHFLYHSHYSNGTHDDDCRGWIESKDYETKCLHLKSKNPCVLQGYINYLYIFYCVCGRLPVLGYTLFLVWLVVLFYVLGDTASVYFCSSLENLSRVLKLSPAVAGVTLLSLGNGAPDLFSSIASFAGDGTGGLGLNSVLGGAVFVSSVVVGVMSIAISPSRIAVDKSSFVRDICFFLLALSSLLLILIFGKVNLWGAMGFLSLYFVYVLVVSATDYCRRKDREVMLFAIDSLLPISKGYLSHESTEIGTLEAPLLNSIDREEPVSMGRDALPNHDDNQRDETGCLSFNSSVSSFFGWVLFLLELPLCLPRRLTIPVISEEGWSKPFAVISVTLAPVLLVALWNSQSEDMGFKASLVIYICGGLVGVVLGILAFVTTVESAPPKRFLFPWLAGGFLMSVVWTYITAEELVALLVSIGYIIGISPSILGLTVLAWGNSIGDLIANVAMAVNGGPVGAQIAISGCYAGPIFNTLVGLGLSLVFSCWHVYPSYYMVPSDPSLFQTMGFLVSGLLWALLVLPRRHMRPDRFLGAGLLAIYVCFLSLRLLEHLAL